MNEYELKIKALLEGLEIQNIEKFMRVAKVGDYRNLGKAYVSAVRELIEEEKPKPLFITDDGVELFDEADKLFIVNKEYYKKESKISNLYDKANRKYFKYFFHESNADEYIWRNKPVFSYHEIWKYAPYGSTLSIFEKLAKERMSNENYKRTI